MVNYHSTLVSALNLILPTHYEMTLTSGTVTPCISYMEINNYSSDIGDTLGYSRVTYQIKVWSNKVSDLQTYALQIDDALRVIGFKRISSGELYDRESTMMQKVLTYEALFKEEFSTEETSSVE